MELCWKDCRVNQDLKERKFYFQIVTLIVFVKYQSDEYHGEKYRSHRNTYKFDHNFQKSINLKQDSELILVE